MKAAAARPLGLTVMDAAEGFIVGRAGRGVLLRVSATAPPPTLRAISTASETRPALVAPRRSASSSASGPSREAIRHGGETLAYSPCTRRMLGATPRVCRTRTATALSASCRSSGPV
ncbi:MAG: hypothetical protein R3C52_00930 [Hyphomonadaceae bacterium]